MGQKPSGAIPITRRSSMRKGLKAQLAETREAKKQHKESGHCERPDTCGGCHFWSGSIAALCKALGLPAEID